MKDISSFQAQFGLRPVVISFIAFYGKGDTKPNEDVMHFVDNVWQPKAKSIIQKMQEATEKKVA